MAGLAGLMLVSLEAFAEIELAGQSGLDHQREGPVYRRLAEMLAAHPQGVR